MIEYFSENYESAIEHISNALTLAFELFEEDQALPIKREMTNVLQKIGEIENDEEILELTTEIIEKLDSLGG
jgi:hypothetical protein